MTDKGDITQAIEAFQDAIDNYITVIANEQQTPVEEIKADPVVAGWIESLEALKAFKEGEGSLAKQVLNINKVARDQGLWIGGGYNASLPESEQEGPLWKAILKAAKHLSMA